MSTPFNSFDSSARAAAAFRRDIPVLLKKPVRACVRCHNSKVKCKFSTEDQTKCDRCKKKDWDCVPHNSIQGQKTHLLQHQRDVHKTTDAPAVSVSCIQSSASSGKLATGGSKRAVDDDITHDQSDIDTSNGGDAILSNILTSDKVATSQHTTIQEQNQSADSCGNCNSQAAIQYPQHALLQGGQSNELFGSCILAAGQNVMDVNLPTCQLTQNQTVNGAANSNKSMSNSSMASGQTLQFAQMQHQIGQNTWQELPLAPSNNCVPDCASISRVSGISLNSAPVPDSRTLKQCELTSNQLSDEEAKGIPLQLWIKRALDGTGESNKMRAATSAAYIEACMKVAKSLTEQLRYDCPGLATTVKSNDGWSKYVMIHLEENERTFDGDDDGSLQPFMEQNQDLNDELNAFQKRFCLDESEDDRAYSCSDDKSRNIDEQLISLLDVSEADDGKQDAPDFSSTTDASTKQRNYLCVYSANFICSGSHSACNNVERDKLKRIYYLALVFYEMFSGGTSPPPTLYRLASTDGAFVYLPTLTLVDPSNEDYMNSPNEPKRHQGPSGSGDKVRLCKLSFEYLKFIGVPGPICHLILNMLDCVYGALSGSESYACISDISSDLQLMLDKPKLLKGLDTNKLSSSELPLEDLCLPRHQEIQSILTSYQQCMSGSREVVIVKGESGAGKSILAQCAASSLISNGGLVLMGKFDQMQQSRPFSALASALDQYLDVLISQLGSDWAGSVVRQLQATLGTDVYFLTLILPKLGLLLNVNTNESMLDNLNDFHSAGQRIQYLLCQFVDVISTTSLVSVTLCLDDVQWADQASISVLNRVLTQSPGKFFFLACCRDTEMSNDHQFWKLIESARGNGVATTTVDLKNTKEDVLNAALSDLLCLSPRLVKPLSKLIYHKTKGNAQFIAELLRSLSRDGLLRIDLNSQRWVWDEEKICSTKLPDNVALCFSDAIKKLPVEVQLALHVLSMFGASVTIDCMNILESQLGLNISEPLKVAATEGLVVRVKGLCSFTHDRIQETCYNMIQEKDRRSNSLTYGRCLAQLALQNNDDDMLFTAVNQINFGGPSAVTVKDEYYAMAQYNLTAGKKAMQMSDFTLAYNLFNHGISFLQAESEHWRNNYQLSLEIHELGAKAALASSSSRGIHSFSKAVIDHARCFEDKLNTFFVIISSLACTSRVPEALRQGIEIIARLGESVPNNLSPEELDRQTNETLSSIIKFTSDMRVNSDLNVMTDTTKLAVMRFLAQLHLLAIFGHPLLHPFLILKMVQCTATYGFSPESPIALVCFGSFLVKRGKFSLGCRFTSLAKALLDKLNGSQMTSGEVLCIYGEVQCLVEPVITANEWRKQGELKSLSAGDVNYSCFNRLQRCISEFYAGCKLHVIKEQGLEACRFMRQQGNLPSLTSMLIMNRTILALLGETDDTLAQYDAWRNINENNIPPRQVMTLTFQELYLSFLLCRGDTKECCEKFIAVSTLASGLMMFADLIKEFIVGLASFRVYRETRDVSWMERGCMCLKQCKTWAEQGSQINFGQKLLLLEAEESYCRGNFDAAKELYKEAIMCAKSTIMDSVIDEALAYELAAKFFLDTNDIRSSLEHFMLAHEAYGRWGSITKANALFLFIHETFAQFV